MPETMTARAPQMPAFDYQPRPYDGPTRDEVLAAGGSTPTRPSSRCTASR